MFAEGQMISIKHLGLAALNATFEVAQQSLNMIALEAVGNSFKHAAATGGVIAGALAAAKTMLFFGVLKAGLAGMKAGLAIKAGKGGIALAEGGMITSPTHALIGEKPGAGPFGYVPELYMPMHKDNKIAQTVYSTFKDIEREKSVTNITNMSHLTGGKQPAKIENHYHLPGMLPGNVRSLKQAVRVLDRETKKKDKLRSKR